MPIFYVKLCIKKSQLKQQLRNTKTCIILRILVNPLTHLRTDRDLSINQENVNKNEGYVKRLCYLGRYPKYKFYHELHFTFSMSISIYRMKTSYGAYPELISLKLFHENTLEITLEILRTPRIDCIAFFLP